MARPKKRSTRSMGGCWRIYADGVDIGVVHGATREDAGNTLALVMLQENLKPRKLEWVEERR